VQIAEATREWLRDRLAALHDAGLQGRKGSRAKFRDALRDQDSYVYVPNREWSDLDSYRLIEPLAMGDNLTTLMSDESLTGATHLAICSVPFNALAPDEGVGV
jgi:hypothetical protein